MWIKKLFPFTFRGKQWHKDHYQFWIKYLELNNESISRFQKNLSDEIKNLLELSNISYIEEIEEDKHFIIQKKIAKTIIIKLTDFKDSIFWIYFDGSQYKLKGKYHIYENISYLKPEELNDRYFKEVKKILNLN